MIQRQLEKHQDLRRLIMILSFIFGAIPSARAMLVSAETGRQSALQMMDNLYQQGRRSLTEGGGLVAQEALTELSQIVQDPTLSFELRLKSAVNVGLLCRHRVAESLCHELLTLTTVQTNDTHREVLGAIASRIAQHSTIPSKTKSVLISAR